MLDSGKSLVLGYFLNVVGDAVLVEELGLVEASGLVLGAENEEDIRVNDRLTLEDIMEELVRDLDISKHLEVRTPAGLGTGMLLFTGLLFETADVVALLEVELILEAVANDLNVHELGGELSRA